MTMLTLGKQRVGAPELPVSGPGLFVFVVFLAGGGIGAALLNHPGPAIAGAVLGVYFLWAIRVAQQWEKAAVLRLGRYRRLCGPGVFLIVPIIDTVSRYVDQRVLAAHGARAKGAWHGGSEQTVENRPWIRSLLS